MGTLTQSKLKKLMRYDPLTGAFIRRCSISGGGLAGTEAGTDNGRGYIRIMIDGALYRAHRLAFLYVDGAFPADGVDHVNQNPSDNRWANLRAVTQQENGKNQKLYITNTSGTMGVYWNKRAAKWTASIDAIGKRFNLGYFSTKTEAIAARKVAEKKHGFHKNHGALRGTI